MARRGVLQPNLVLHKKGSFYTVKSVDRWNVGGSVITWPHDPPCTRLRSGLGGFSVDRWIGGLSVDRWIGRWTLGGPSVDRWFYLIYGTVPVDRYPWLNGTRHRRSAMERC